jgi:benzylsuccinate CoA-transferase BbsF subunit
MGWVWAGAVCGQILAEWGAEVIKVESRTRLDPARQGRPIVGDTPDPEQNPLFHNANQRKQSISINIKTASGAELVRALVARSDVLIENMTPHALRTVGLDFEALREVNPRLIMVSHPLAGSSGPHQELRGYGPTAGSLVGLDNLIGYTDSDEVIGFPNAVADPLVGVQAATSVLAALRERERSGTGQHIELSMLECLLSCMAYGLLDYQLNGDRGRPRENDHPLYAPHGIYPCKAVDGEEGWIGIAVESQTEWSALCSVLGAVQLSGDVRFADRARRRMNRGPLDAALCTLTAGYERFDLEARLQAHGVAGTACLGPRDRYLDEHLKQRGMYVDVEHPVLGVEPLYGTPIRFSRWQPAPIRRAPLLGEHTDSVLAGVLGLSPTEIDSLRSSGALT